MKSVVIAKRELLYSLKGEDERKSLSVKVFAPHLVEEGTVNFKFSSGTACCVITFEEIEEQIELVGMDSLQALQLVSNVDRYIALFGKRYDFYWATGEPYFDAELAGP